MTKAALILFPVILMTACLPIPHTERQVPHIKGIITLKGVPQAGVRVFLNPHCSMDYRAPAICEHLTRKTRTDEQGQFAFSSVHDFFLFVTIGDPGGCWEVCIEHEGSMLKGLRDKWFGMHPPKKTQLICDLSKEPINRGVKPAEYDEGYCAYKKGWGPWEQYDQDHPKPPAGQVKP